jgi:large repetitive protein
VQQSFTVIPAPSAQTITFHSNAPANAVYTGPSYTVSATASSGLPVTVSVSGTCTLSGSTVAMAGAGTCTVYANQSGSSAYFAAPQEQQTFSIAKRAQTITFPDPGNHDRYDPPFPLSATSSSGLAVTYTLDPSSTPFCSLSGNVVTPIERGDCTVYANQAGDANYLAAPQVTMVIKIKNHTPGGGG